MSEAVAQIPTGSSEQPLEINPEEVKKEATALFAQGKRSLLIHDYKSAVTSLEDACRLFDQIYGVSADECGDAYLQYGTALMELARQETGVLDGVVSADAEESSDDEEDEEGGEEEEGEEKADEVKEPTPSESADKAQIASDEELAKKLAEEDLNEAEAASSAALEPVAGTSSGAEAPAATGTGEEEEDDPEPSSFECAWELLCLARDVFKRQIEYKGSEAKIKLAEALQALGEISIEWENNEAALEILQDSLSMRKEVLPPDDRLIAETYYHIGIAFSFMNEFERSNDCFRSAIQVIEDRIKNLKATCATTDNDATKTRHEREIAELESLLPEMNAKIEDSKDQVKSTSEVMKEIDDEESKESEMTAKIHDSPAKPVNNIMHLVKRKREPEIENGTNGTKKVCATNGSGDVATPVADSSS